MEIQTEKNISIYDYLDYRKFLLDFFIVYKKTTNLTISSVSRKCLGVSKGFLSLVINGKRNLSLGAAEELGLAIGLKQKELMYFENLVKFNQSKSLNEKVQIIDHIKEFKPIVNKQTFKYDQYSILVNWHALVVLELTRLVDFKDDAKWVSNKLKKYLSEAECKIALQRLIDNGLLKKDVNQKLVASDKPIKTSDELKSLAIQRYHHSCLDLAKRVLMSSNVEDREFASVNKLMTHEQFKIVKQKIKNLRDEILEMTDKNQGESRSVYQINFQMLNLSIPEEI